MTTLDLAWIREQFPALQQTHNGKPLVFFDGPGGTQVPQRVLDAISNYLINANANAHGSFVTSQRSDAILNEAHAAMADLLGCDPDEVAFGGNMTTLTFAFSRALGREFGPGDEIVLTRLDHDANFAPWKALEERGVTVRVVDVDVEDCTLDMDDLRSQLNERTKLVAVGYASNAVGSINDVKEITRLAHEVGALTFIDAVHYAPHGSIDVRDIDCDFLACSPYKFFGPHSGTLYGKREHMQRLQPYKVRPAADMIPDRWETGTKSHEAMAGVTAAIDYLAELGREVSGNQELSRREALVASMNAIQLYERELVTKLIDGLLTIPGLSFYGIRESERYTQRTPTVAIRLESHTPAEIAQYLGLHNIFVWDGNYYAINLTERLGLEQSGGMVRIGLTHYNTVEEVELLLKLLRELVG